MLRNGLSILGALIFAVVAIWLFRSGSSGPAEEPRIEQEASEGWPAPLTDPADSPRASPPVITLKGDDPADSGSLLPDPPRVILPTLGKSDPFVRARLESLALPEDWVAREGLVRRLAVLVDNVVLGELPRRQLRFLKPAESFAVVERDGRLYADPANPRRFEPFLDLLESIEPAGLANLLVLLGPLLDEAFAELGSGTSAHESILAAIDRVLEMPVVPGDSELVQRKVLYEYADTRLEGLPPLEKQLLRLGEAGRARLEAYLVEVRSELDPGPRP